MRWLLLLLPLIFMLNGCAAFSKADGSQTPSAFSPTEDMRPSQPSQEETPEQSADALDGPIYLLYDEETETYTVLDHDGKELLPQPYDMVERLAEDRLCVSVRQSGDQDGTTSLPSAYLCALCDLSGNLLTDFQYESMTALTYRTDVALALSSSPSGSWALLDIRTGDVLASLPSGTDLDFMPLDGGEYLLSSHYPSTGEMEDNPNTYALYSLDRLLAGDATPLWTVEHASDCNCDRSVTDGILLAFTNEDQTTSYQLLGPSGPYFGGKRYENLRGFCEDLAGAMENGLWGYLDREGRWAVTPQFAECGDFSEGFAAVSIGEQNGFINARGEWLVNPRYHNAGAFCDGYANCEIYDSVTGETDYVLLGRDGGEMELPGILNGSFSQGNGYALANCMEEEADGSFYDKLWRVAQDGDLAYVGDYSIDFQMGNVASLVSYNEGEDAVACGLYDVSTGEWICEPGQYQSFSQFYPNSATLAMEDTNGAEEIPYLAACRAQMGVSLCDLMDLRGNVILSGCNEISYVDDGRAIVKKGFSQGMMDFQGNWLWRSSIFTGMEAMD